MYYMFVLQIIKTHHMHAIYNYTLNIKITSLSWYAKHNLPDVNVSISEFA